MFVHVQNACQRARPLLILPLLLWGGGLFAQAPAPAGDAQVFEAREFEARVIRVFDGDTLWVKPLTGGRYRKLRLDGLDAPEICQAGGTASRDALADRVLEQVVTVNQRAHDDYGRALVHLTHAGDDVGAWLVLQGHAWSYRWHRSPGPYAAQEQQARAQAKGIFGAAGAEEPRDFRRRHGPCPLPGRG